MHVLCKDSTLKHKTSIPSFYMYTLLINVGDMTHDPMTILPPAFTMYNCGVSNGTFIAITDINFLFYLIINSKTEVFEKQSILV